ncbi:MAG: ribonuclease P protein component [Candidatus Omnitrophota bacterium]
MKAGHPARSAQKLCRRGEFQETYARGRKFRGRYLILFCAPNRLEQTRLGLSVGKKSFKLSTQRHLIQRRLREAYRRHKQQFAAGYDLVIVSQRFDEKRTTFAQLAQELLDLAKKAGILLNNVNSGLY